MDVDRWQDRKSGAKRQRMKVVADNVQFLRIRRSVAEEPPADPGSDAAGRGAGRPRRAPSEAA
jgi:single-stranded DNA-binding protein